MTGLGIIFALLFVGGMMDQRRPRSFGDALFVVGCMVGALGFGWAGAR